MEVEKNINVQLIKEIKDQLKDFHHVEPSQMDHICQYIKERWLVIDTNSSGTVSYIELKEFFQQRYNDQEDIEKQMKEFYLKCQTSIPQEITFQNYVNYILKEKLNIVEEV